MSTISNFLSVDRIALDTRAADWRDAICAAGTLLERDGIASSEYTEAMIDTVVEHGPYIVIAPGVAFAHARPSEAVYETGMAFIRLSQPVKFGHNANDPVSIVFALAARDSRSHQKALSSLASTIGNTKKRQELESAPTAASILEILSAAPTKKRTDNRKSRNKILTVCGNGVGTSLFLKNTVEYVLDVWGWSPYVSVEAADTISARGKAKESDFILTSGAIANTLGEVDVPVCVIENFTSHREVDAALRELYDLEELS
ncbi:MAG: PTS sugar transporter subunit IIA [Corynebacterium sp.]|nr:PTS sugar transporter subunit IIA [Corynebacterium sp.]